MTNGGCSKPKRSLALKIWRSAILLVAILSWEPATPASVKCQLQNNLVIICFPADNSSHLPLCHCCTTTASKETMCEAQRGHLSSLLIHVKVNRFHFGNVTQVTKNPIYVGLIYKKPKTILPFTFYNVSSLKEIRIEGSVIESIENLSFASLPVLITCTITKTFIRTLPLKMFENVPNLTNLNLNDNDLKTILPKTFMFARHLVNLNLRNNSISCLTTDSFEGLDNLKYLDLSFNLLENLRDLQFNAFYPIEGIILDHNRIKFLNKGSFESLNHLRVLSLKSNHIKSIPLNMFLGPFNIHHLDLRNNEVQIFSDKNIAPLFGNFMKLNSSLLLDGNPLECCHLNWRNNLYSGTASLSVKKSLENLICNGISPKITRVYNYITNITDHCLAVAKNSTCAKCNAVNYHYNDTEQLSPKTSRLMVYLNYRQHTKNCSKLLELNYVDGGTLDSATPPVKTSLGTLMNNLDFTLLIFLAYLLYVVL